MESTKIILEQAISHRIRLWAVFFLLLSVILISLNLNLWASKLYGWQPKLISEAFALIGGLSILYLLYFGFLIRGSYKMLPSALALSEWYERDRAAFMLECKPVVGPIPWKFQ